VLVGFPVRDDAVVVLVIVVGGILEVADLGLFFLLDLKALVVELSEVGAHSPVSRQVRHP
jgi:hypothetical protein